MDSQQPHLLAQNRPLSAQECQRALAALDSVAPTLAGREEYVEMHGLDPAFALPDSNWKASGSATDALVAHARHLREDPQNFNFFRFNVAVFTGFDLYFYAKFGDPLELDWSKRPRFILAPLPADMDTHLRQRLSEYGLKRWRFLAGITPPHLMISPPPICGEIGWQINGVIVNYDTGIYQERITLLERLGVLQFLASCASESGIARVLEIGGGYGALAHHIKKFVPKVAYTICDLPESLSMSAAYLALTRPDLRTQVVGLTSPEVDALDAFHFLPNYVLPEIAHTHKFDLVINTLSLSEMSVAQIQCYGALISQLIGDTGMFFEQNQDNVPVGFANCKTHLPRFFSARATIEPPPFTLSQGKVDIWANRSLKWHDRGQAPESCLPSR